VIEHFVCLISKFLTAQSDCSTTYLQLATEVRPRNIFKGKSFLPDPGRKSSGAWADLAAAMAHPQLWLAAHLVLNFLVPRKFPLLHCNIIISTFKQKRLVSRLP